jgi:hypothetical protein
MSSSINRHISQLRGETPSDVARVIDAASELSVSDWGWIAIGAVGAVVGIVGEETVKACHVAADFAELTRDFARVNGHIANSENMLNDN